MKRIIIVKILILNLLWIHLASSWMTFGQTPSSKDSQEFFEPVTESLFMPMNIVIVEATLNGMSLQSGAEIGIFSIDPTLGEPICVGTAYVEDQFLTGKQLVVKATKNDGTKSSLANGFTSGNDLLFKFFIPDVGAIDNISVSFTFPDFDYTFQPQGLAFVSLSATVPTTLLSVTTIVDPADVGIVSGGGIYLIGSSVILNALPYEGFRFYGWYENGNLISQNPEYTFQVEEEKELKAQFYSLRPPPENFNAEVNQNQVLLTWEKPEFAVEGDWKNWDSGENHHSIGKNFGGTFRFAAKWNNLYEYQGWVVNKVAFFPAHPDADFILKVWVGDNATNLVVNQPVTNFSAGEWNEVFLETPVPINIFEELWVGFECEHPANTYPAGCDNGPVNPFFGDLVSFDGASWKSLKFHYNLNYDWNIQVWIEHDIYQYQLPGNLKDDMIESKNDESITCVKNDPTPGFNHTRTEFLGYNVYRDNALVVSNHPDTCFMDVGVSPGIRQYTAKAAYDQGMSLPAGPISVTVDTVEYLSYQLSSGWSGFSTLLIPSDTLLNGNFIQLGDTLLAIANLNQFINLQQDSVTAQHGYFIKLQEDTQIAVTGNQSFSRTFQLETGWNLIPNLSTCEFAPDELVITGNYQIIQEAATFKVYWPEFNIQTLDILRPGRAFLILMTEPGSAEFPNCFNY